MHALSAWFTRNPVAANILMFLVLLAGILTASSLRIESFPRIPPRAVSVTVVYPGATAEQVDEGVTLRIEQALEGMPGVRRTFSQSFESVSLVRVERNSGYDLQRLLNDIRNRVDAIVGLPTSAERPIVTRDEFSVFGLIVQVSGDLDERTLQQAARRVETALMAHPQISNLEVFGKRDYRVSIEVDPAVLEAHGLSMTDVRDAVAQNSLDYRAGTLSSGGGRILLRGDEKAFHAEDFAELPVLTLADGRLLRLEEIATVSDGFDEEQVAARFNGTPSVGMVVNTDNKSNLLRVSEAVHEVLDEIRPQLTDEVALDVWADASVYIRDRLGLLRSNAVQGLIIIFVVLSLFLHPKLSFWVAVGIPVSVAGTLAAMGDRFLGISLNDISTFGLIIVLGFLVDDAIVVAESVYEERKGKRDPIDETVAGVNKVTTATVFGAMTTIAAFFPLVLIDNDIAKIFAGFSIVVIAAVVTSLVESKLILPAHLAGTSFSGETPRSALARAWGRLRTVLDRGLRRFIRSVYRPALVLAIRHKYRVLLGLAVFAALGLGSAFTDRVRLVFFPEVPGNVVTVSLGMDRSSPVSLTQQNALRLESAARFANETLMLRHGLEDPPVGKLMSSLTDEHTVEVYGEISPEAMDRVGSPEILREWREGVRDLEGAEDLHFSASLETGGGFALEVVSADEAVLRDAVGRVTATLSGLSGVDDVRTDLEAGQSEIRLRLRPEARHLGLSIYDLASQAGDGFGGLETQRMQRGPDEVKVFVRLAKNRRDSLHELMTGRVLTPAGDWVPIRSVAELESGYGVGTINRRDGRRTATIYASVDKTVTGSGAVARELAPVIRGIEAELPGVAIVESGELEETGEVQRGMRKALVFVLFLLYALLAIPLKSYSKPLVIMSVIPFAFAGAILGHMIMGLPLSVLSFFGMLAATGVVVNDSLVMTSRYNQLREAGIAEGRALVKAGMSRFRAVFLTTATTVGGLMPLMFETSEQAQYLIPAAVSLAFAEIVATPAALFVVPLCLGVLRDIAHLKTRFSNYLRYSIRRLSVPAPVVERVSRKGGPQDV